MDFKALIKPYSSVETEGIPRSFVHLCTALLPLPPIPYSTYDKVLCHSHTVGPRLTFTAIVVENMFAIAVPSTHAVKSPQKRRHK